MWSCPCPHKDCGMCRTPGLISSYRVPPFQSSTLRSSSSLSVETSAGQFSSILSTKTSMFIVFLADLMFISWFLSFPRSSKCDFWYFSLGYALCVLIIIGELPCRWDKHASAVIPEERVFYLVALLRNALPSSGPGLKSQMDDNSKILRICHDLNCKQYFPTYNTPKQWEQHFGSRWQNFIRLKKMFDPRAILSPGQNIFCRNQILATSRWQNQCFLEDMNLEQICVHGFRYQSKFLCKPQHITVWELGVIATFLGFDRMTKQGPIPKLHQHLQYLLKALEWMGEHIMKSLVNLYEETREER